MFVAAVIYGIGQGFLDGDIGVVVEPIGLRPVRHFLNAFLDDVVLEIPKCIAQLFMDGAGENRFCEPVTNVVMECWRMRVATS